jgi:hypothetical protein
MKAIGNALGKFISLDHSSLQNTSRKVGRILVEVDIHEGLPEIMDIEWRGRHTKQRLDYQGIPFRCSHLSLYWSSLEGLQWQVYEEKSEDTLLQEDPPDYMMEVDSLGEIPVPHYSTASGPPSESLDSLSGKLSFFCPALYSSLSLWEKEALDNSRWLSHATSVVKGIEGGLEPSGNFREPLAPVSDVGRPVIISTPPITVSILSIQPNSPAPYVMTSEINVFRRGIQLLHIPPPTIFVEPFIEPGCREPEEDENWSQHSSRLSDPLS